MTDFDVVIVGGGPVGLAAAIEARLLDLDAAIFEPKLGSVDKACGEGLMPGSLPLLARLGVDLHGHEISGVCYNDSRKSVTYEFRSGKGMGVRRTDLHLALSNRAKQLGVVFINDSVASVQSNPDHVLTVTKSGTSVTSRYLLGADGLHSTVANLVGLTRKVSPRVKARYGIRQHFNVSPWSNLIQVYFTNKAEVYVTPVSPTRIGIAILGPRNTDFESTVNSVPELVSKVDFSAVASRRMGAGSFPQKTVARRFKRVMLIGDASGYVDAITGEGLRLGFAHAQMAVRCVKNDRPQDYEKLWRKVSRDFRWLTTGLTRFATSKLRGAIVPLASWQPKLFGFIVERLAK